VLTTGANEILATIHDRMPVIIPNESIHEWLDRSNTEAESLMKFMLPYSAVDMVKIPVDPKMNNPRNGDSIEVSEERTSAVGSQGQLL